MNCSKSTKLTFDRVCRLTMGLALLLGGIAAGLLLGVALGSAKAPEADILTPAPVLSPAVTPEPTEPAEPEAVSLGVCRITAYCACEKCCGEWAKNRPDGIGYGAAGIELIAGVSCASPWPVGTVVEIEGMGEYTVQDRPAQWVIDKYGKNQFDIYFDDHEAARAFGLQYLTVTVKEEAK